MSEIAAALRSIAARLTVLECGARESRGSAKGPPAGTLRVEWDRTRYPFVPERLTAADRVTGWKHPHPMAPPALFPISDADLRELARAGLPPGGASADVPAVARLDAVPRYSLDAWCPGCRRELAYQAEQPADAHTCSRSSARRKAVEALCAPFRCARCDGFSEELTPDGLCPVCSAKVEAGT